MMIKKIKRMTNIKFETFVSMQYSSEKSMLCVSSIFEY
jgi:hypothetical protein